MSTGQSSKPIPVVCALILDKRGRVLAAKRGICQDQCGLWEFPGGKIDEKEQEIKALERELEEELGIKVKVGSRLEPYCHHYPTFTIFLIPYICGISEGVPIPHEHEEIFWVTPLQAAALEWAPADIPILKQYAELFMSRRVFREIEKIN
ncbi:NUDIX hydrolase, MutT family [Chitinispirillum alkaliphilum]|nr:NUDIX hydrolase, MutT family [Chitinispirillum alkaliphilum]